MDAGMRWRLILVLVALHTLFGAMIYFASRSWVDTFVAVVGLLPAACAGALVGLGLSRFVAGGD